MRRSNPTTFENNYHGEYASKGRLYRTIDQDATAINIEFKEMPRKDYKLPSVGPEVDVPMFTERGIRENANKKNYVPVCNANGSRKSKASKVLGIGNPKTNILYPHGQRQTLYIPKDPSVVVLPFSKFVADNSSRDGWDGRVGIFNNDKETKAMSAPSILKQPVTDVRNPTKDQQEQGKVTSDGNVFRPNDLLVDNVTRFMCETFLPEAAETKHTASVKFNRMIKAMLVHTSDAGFGKAMTEKVRKLVAIGLSGGKEGDLLFKDTMSDITKKQEYVNDINAIYSMNKDGEGVKLPILYEMFSTAVEHQDSQHKTGYARAVYMSPNDFIVPVMIGRHDIPIAPKYAPTKAYIAVGDITDFVIDPEGEDAMKESEVYLNGGGSGGGGSGGGFGGGFSRRSSTSSTGSTGVVIPATPPATPPTTPPLPTGARSLAGGGSFSGATATPLSASEQRLLAFKNDAALNELAVKNLTTELVGNQTEMALLDPVTDKAELVKRSAMQKTLNDEMDVLLLKRESIQQQIDAMTV